MKPLSSHEEEIRCFNQPRLYWLVPKTMKTWITLLIITIITSLLFVYWLFTTREQLGASPWENQPGTNYSGGGPNKGE